MNENQKRILTGLTALILAGQLAAPAFARAEDMALEGDVAVSETFPDPKLQS